MITGVLMLVGLRGAEGMAGLHLGTVAKSECRGGAAQFRWFVPVRSLHPASSC